MQQSLITRVLGHRTVVFSLAWLSFGCLLGQFYGLWRMHVFGCWVLPPATALLVLAAYLHRHGRGEPDNAWTWIVHGAVGGMIAAIGYDLYRLPFVLSGEPLFKVFPQFGQVLVGRSDPRWLVQAVGWAYHFSNGAALGIMVLVLVSSFRRPALFWGSIVWAVFVEAMLLLTPYASFFGLKLNSRFLFLTASAHVVFGAVMGAYLRWRLPSVQILAPSGQASVRH